MTTTVIEEKKMIIKPMFTVYLYLAYAMRLIGFYADDTSTNQYATPPGCKHSRMNEPAICPRGIDYYGVLGLNKCATNAEINDAYRRLALQYNPEKNNDPSLYGLFALIGEAYEVLNLPLLRAIYDQYGEAGLKKGVATPYGYNPPYVYHGEAMQTYNEGWQGRSRCLTDVELGNENFLELVLSDYILEVEHSNRWKDEQYLTKAPKPYPETHKKNFFGTVNPYGDLLTSIDKPPRMFDFAGGNALKQKEKPYKKPLFLKLEEVYHGGLKIIKIQRKMFRDETEEVADLEDKLLNITVTPGIPPGTEITFPECGDQSYSAVPGDIIFVVEDKPHPVFKREGVDLIMSSNISVEQSLVGVVLTINTLDDRTIRVAITEVVTPEYVKVVHGEGMPYPNDRDKKGDLRIKFHVEYPKFIPHHSKKMIARAFAMTVEANDSRKADNQNKVYTSPTFSNQPGIQQVRENVFRLPQPQAMSSLAFQNPRFLQGTLTTAPPVLSLNSDVKIEKKF